MSRLVTLGGFALFVCCAALLGGIVLFGAVGGGPAVTIEGADPAVSVGPPLSTAETDGVETCTSTGAPPGSVALTGTVALRRTDSGGAPIQVDLAVSAADTLETTRTVEIGSAERVRLLATDRADGSIAPGSPVSVEILVTHEGRTLDRTTVTVEPREAPGCVES